MLRNRATFRIFGMAVGTRPFFVEKRWRAGTMGGVLFGQGRGAFLFAEFRMVKSHLGNEIYILFWRNILFFILPWQDICFEALSQKNLFKEALCTARMFLALCFRAV